MKLKLHVEDACIVMESDDKKEVDLLPIYDNVDYLLFYMTSKYIKWNYITFRAECIKSDEIDDMNISNKFSLVVNGIKYNNNEVTICPDINKDDKLLKYFVIEDTRIVNWMED